MALIIEDGSVVPGADSFIDVVDAQTMAEKYGLGISSDTITAEVQLRQAYLALLRYEPTLQGNRVSGSQTGIYPRTYVELYCEPVASDTIPNQVIMAQLYQVDAIETSGYNSNVVDNGQELSGFNIQGTYSETYQSNSKQKLNAVVQGVTNALYPLSKAGACGGQFGRGIGREEFGFIGR